MNRSLVVRGLRYEITGAVYLELRHRLLTAWDRLPVFPAAYEDWGRAVRAALDGLGDGELWLALPSPLCDLIVWELERASVVPPRPAD